MTAAFPQVPRHPRLAVAFLLSIGIFVGVTRDNVSHVIATTRTRVVAVKNIVFLANKVLMSLRFPRAISGTQQSCSKAAGLFFGQL